ncbi:MAG: ABC transporter permease [Pedosphaera parvula]|nr:ABC transporter permease [Pedosphaera parvula]
MRQFLTIATNAFMELVRQPVFLLLMTCSAVFCVFLAAVPYFGFGDDPKMVKDSVLAVMFLSGLFGAVLNASASVAHEIRSGTALAVLAKPVGRAQFILAKYVGLAGALAVLTYVNLLAALLASRMAFDAYGDADITGTSIYYGSIALAYLIGGFRNYFLRRPFVADAVFAVVVMTTAAFIVIEFFVQQAKPFGEVAHVDWHMVPAGILILFALLILAGLALACSTRFELIPTLAICSGLFLLGLMSDWLLGQRAQEASEAGIWWASATYSVLYTLIPNWQLFWLADALETGKSIPAGYIVKALGYVIGYLGAALVLALLMFEDRELN